MKGVICIGAHYGEEVEGWLSLGITDFILFEPVYKSFQRLEKIMSSKTGNFKLINSALGNTKGHKEMFTESVHQGKSSSILEPHLHLEQYPDIEFDSRELVRMERLDDIDYDRAKYDIMHIDTQGYELEVLKGAEKSLKHIHLITCEVYRKELYRGCPMIEEVSAWLGERGFVLEDVFWKGLSWGDAKYINVKP